MTALLDSVFVKVSWLMMIDEVIIIFVIKALFARIAEIRHFWERK